jgi:hypothetical protein
MLTMLKLDLAALVLGAGYQQIPSQFEPFLSLVV